LEDSSSEIHKKISRRNTKLQAKNYPALNFLTKNVPTEKWSGTSGTTETIKKNLHDAKKLFTI
jgi:hypothetical protein